MANRYLDGAKWESTEAGTWTHPGYGSVVGDGKDWWAIPNGIERRSGPYPSMKAAAQWLTTRWQNKSLAGQASAEARQREKRSRIARPR